VIIGGLNKEILYFFLVKKPQINLFSTRKAFKSQINLFKALFSLIAFSPLLIKEKSLYNTALLDNIKAGVLRIGTLLR